MLYLEPPFHIIDDISVFRDHEDPLQYYYMPLYPHLTVKHDDETDADIPQLQLIKYRGEAGSGGFLNFDVNLGMTEDQLRALTSAIRSKDNLDEEPRIGPVPLTGGTVKLMLFGKESEVPPAEGETGTPAPETSAEDPKFVVKMVHSAHPALYGTNQASFSVQLDEAGVVVAEQSLQGEMSPIGVVYSLDFMALRKGYSVRVTADWDRVQKHMQDSFSVNTPFYSSQVDKVVDELIENQVIEFTVDKLFVSDDSTAGMEARMDQAVSEVKDMVLDSFFEPSLEPLPREDVHDTISDVGRVAQLIASGGASENTLFTRKKVDITRIDKKRLDVNMTEKTAVIKSIYPQAHLEGLFRTLRQDGVDLSRFIQAVELDHPWFQKRKVRVIARTDFEKDKIESLNVLLKYGNDQKNILLDKSKTENNVEWLSKLTGGEMERKVTVSYKINFKDEDSMERPTTLTSPEEVIEVENYEVRPTDLYGSVPVAIMALDFPWDLYSHVEVQVAYQDEANRINVDDSFLLKPDATEATWDLFTLDPARNSFRYKLIYRAKDHRDIEMPWQETDQEKVTIRDPFPDKRRLMLVPAIDWTQVKNVFIDVVYEDEANHIRETQSVSFSETSSEPVEVILKQFKDPEHRIISYKTTMIYKDGRIVEPPASLTLADRVFISPEMRGHQIIAIDPEDLPFKAKKIRDAEVHLRYEDAEAGLSFEDVFTFKSPEERIKYFEYDFANPEKSQYDFQLVLHHENGLTRQTDWNKAGEKVLELTD